MHSRHRGEVALHRRGHLPRLEEVVVELESSRHLRAGGVALEHRRHLLAHGARRLRLVGLHRRAGALGVHRRAGALHLLLEARVLVIVLGLGRLGFGGEEAAVRVSLLLEAAGERLEGGLLAAGRRPLASLSVAAGCPALVRLLLCLVQHGDRVVERALFLGGRAAGAGMAESPAVVADHLVRARVVGIVALHDGEVLVLLFFPRRQQGIPLGEVGGGGVAAADFHSCRCEGGERL